MKDRYASSCGCQKPRPPCDCQSRPPHPLPESLFMQRILGYGRIHQRRKCYDVHIAASPCCPSGSLTLTSASVCGMPAWEEMPCHERGVQLLRIMIPISLALQDCNGCVRHENGVIEEELRLRLACQPCDAWRGQIQLQAAVRLCGAICLQPDSCIKAPLELILCGYLLTPCTAGTPDIPHCPPPKPWYPQPRYNPYQDLFPERD